MTAPLVTCITTVSAITLSEDFSLGDVVENVKELGSWINSWLPKNIVVRTMFYGATTVVCLRFIPVFLRRTSFFKNVEIQSRYFHRSTALPELIKIKEDLLKELQDESHELPANEKGKLTLLELNAGGGTNMSYYPDGCVYIATDHWDGAKDYLEQNFSDVDEPRITLDRFLLTKPDRLISVPDNTVSAVICFHSLCSSCNVHFTLLEILRVLKPGGKMYFIEHVMTKERYTNYWLLQMNYVLQMTFWDCSLRDLGSQINRAGFSKVNLSEVKLNFKGVGMMGPMRSLAPHIYGYAVK